MRNRRGPPFSDPLPVTILFGMKSSPGNTHRRVSKCLVDSGQIPYATLSQSAFAGWQTWAAVSPMRLPMTRPPRAPGKPGCLKPKAAQFYSHQLSSDDCSKEAPLQKVLICPDTCPN